MISKSLAEQAMKDLGLAGWGFTEEDVQRTYREAAKFAHPDGGGTMEAFVKIDKAKCILLEWLKKGGEASRPTLQKDDCQNCAGKGRVVIRKGFATMTITCGRCKGSGDAAWDEDTYDT